MRKNIYVSDPRVEKALLSAPNASKLIEEAILYYLWSQENGFVTYKELNLILARYFKENGIHTKDTLYLNDN